MPIRPTLLTNDLITVLYFSKLCFTFRADDNTFARYVDLIFVSLPWTIWLHYMLSPYLGRCTIILASLSLHIHFHPDSSFITDQLSEYPISTL